MYDDWGNEIAVAEPVFPPPDHLFVSEIPAASPAGLEDGLWDEMPIQAQALPYEFSFSDVDDAFVLPQGDGTGSFGMKPGSDDDWLTPLSNEDVDDLGEIVVDGEQPPSPGEYYDGGDDDWNPSHDTDQQPSNYDPPPQQPIPENPDCDRAEDIGMIEAPDGAKYYVPEGVTAAFLIGAIKKSD